MRKIIITILLFTSILSMYVWACMYACMCMHVYVGVCRCMYVYVVVHICMSVCGYLHACVCAYVCSPCAIFIGSVYSRLPQLSTKCGNQGACSHYTKPGHHPRNVRASDDMREVANKLLIKRMQRYKELTLLPRLTGPWHKDLHAMPLLTCDIPSRTRSHSCIKY